jgi:hypothetical protein
MVELGTRYNESIVFSLELDVDCLFDDVVIRVRYGREASKFSVFFSFFLCIRNRIIQENFTNYWKNQHN